MREKKIVIVGGVAGGASAAARLRRLDESAEIIMVERGVHISFANCGLPYYLGDTIKDKAKLLVQTPEAMFQRFRIDVRINSEVVGIDPANKTLRIVQQDGRAYTESYDKLVLSPGAKPIRPAIPGIDNPRILTLRTIPDIERIKALVEQQATSSAVVVGGGFIGVEVAENLRQLGLDVSLVEAAPHILAPFDSEMAGLLEKELEAHGVRLHVGNGVQAFRETDGKIEVQLSAGNVLSADMAILAIGVLPDTRFLRDSGIELGPKGHIIVNKRLQTNFSDIYAVGDAIEVADFISEAKTAVPLAGPANKQGRIAADQICGLNSVYNGTQGTAIIKVFSLTGAATGLNERALKRQNIPYHVIYVHPASHASYYPGAKSLTIKLLFADSGAILGAQAVGAEGADKRIDVLAAAIRLKGTVYDLAELELAYAPPYSSAKDPVNMAGFAAENVLSGKTAVFLPADLAARYPETTMLVDVRTAAEFNRGHIAGAILLPLDEIRGRLQELDKDKEIWIYCQAGLRGYVAARILQLHGFSVKNLTGGYLTYEMSRYTPTC